MKERKRNLGIDLLRIICMLAIVIQHLLGHGWVVQLLHPETWKYELAVALRSLCMVGVSGFALISGYVGIQGRYRYSSLILQWTKVWLYSVLFTLLGSVLVPGSVSREDWICALLPTLHKQAWYFTAYAGCFMIAPMIRMAMKQMNMKQASVCTAMLILVFSLLSNVLGNDAFYVNAGQGTLWLTVLYAVGAYFGWFQPHVRAPKAALWAFAAVSAALLAIGQPLAQRLGLTWLSADPKNNSLITLMTAIALLLLFSRMEIRRGAKPIAALGAASFGVYLIHEHPQVRRYTISKYAYLLTEMGNVQMIVCAVLAAAMIYLCCALVDMLREKAYRALGVKRRIEALESRLLGDLWAD